MAITGPFGSTRFPVTANSSDSTAGDRTFTVTGDANYKAVVVVILHVAVSAPVTGVLYGGVAMTLSADAIDNTEAGRVVIYTLVDSNAAATGTITITLQGCTTQGKVAQFYGYQADATALEVGDTSILSDQGPNTTRVLTMNPTVGQSALAVGGLHDGNTSPPASDASYTPVANTGTSANIDWGTRAAEAQYSTPADTSGTITIGWTTTVSDDWCFAGVAFQEVASAAGGTINPHFNAIPFL